MQEKIYYFAYGANLNLLIMLKRGIFFCEPLHAVAFDWKRYMEKLTKSGFAAANIRKEEGALTYGVVYTLFSKEDLLKIDRAEGPGYHREKISLYIPRFKCSLFAWAYIAVEPKEDIIPSAKYLETIRRGYEQHCLFEQARAEDLKLSTYLK